MKKSAYIFSVLIITVLAIITYGCGNDTPVTPIGGNSDSCGSSTSLSHQFIGGNFAIPPTYTLANMRYFNFFIHIDSICTDQHLNTGYVAFMVDTPTVPVNFRAAVEWSILYERVESGNLSIENGVREWSAEIHDVGFKTPFGERAADAYLNVYVYFPTLGSIQQDSAFLRRNIQGVNISAQYKLHRPSALKSGNLINKDNFSKVEFVFEATPNKNRNGTTVHFFRNDRTYIFPEIKNFVKL